MTLESYLAMKQITKSLEEIDEGNNYRIKNYTFWKYNMARKFAIKKKVNREIHLYDYYYYYYL